MMLKGKLGVSILFENSLVYNLVEPLRYVLTIEKKKTKKNTNIVCALLCSK